MKTSYICFMNENLLKTQIKSIAKGDYETNMIMILLFPNNSEYYFMKCSHGHVHPTFDKICKYCLEDNLISYVNELDLNLDEDYEDEVVSDPIKEYKSDKVQEITDSLKYLKSKETKTKQDKESIYTLETILKNYS